MYSQTYFTEEVFMLARVICGNVFYDNLGLTKLKL